MSESDEALVLKSRNGDRASFEELVRRVARLVFARIFLEVGDVHRAEDLVQETFLIAWKSIRQVSEPAGFRSWLFSIAHSAVVDAARRESRKKRSGPRADADVIGTIAAAAPGPADAAEKSEERDKVLSVLRSLPEEYRMPLMLRYIGGADYQTIGQQLGLSNGSLRGMLSRGLSMLRSRLTKNAGADAWM
ncbi:MAG TPA: RNA polymerase sigma factor [Tepidisphaeraceae bacterium]|nr:RNA polymerase sigma factor [Tepidisphaeraceae bacterium]